MEPKQPLHDEAMLLSGYVSQTLSSEQQQQVDNHLKTCLTCQHELQEVTNMQTAIQASIADRPGPSPAAFSTLMRRIEQEKRALQPQAPESCSTSWWETVEAAFRSLFEIQWVPALASVLIVGQAFLLLNLHETPESQQSQETNIVIERGIPRGTPTTPSMQIQVTFVETATEIQIRELLKKLGGQIVKGPTIDGFYTLQFPQTKMSPSLLETLQSHSELIKAVSSLNP